MKKKDLRNQSTLDGKATCQKETINRNSRVEDALRQILFAKTPFTCCCTTG